MCLVDQSRLQSRFALKGLVKIEAAQLVESSVVPIGRLTKGALSGRMPAKPRAAVVLPEPLSPLRRTLSRQSTLASISASFS